MAPDKHVVGLWQLLHRLKIHSKCARAHVHSPDPVYLDKLRTVRVCVASARHVPALTTVLFLDEMTYYCQPTLARAYEASGPCQPLAELGYGRNQAWRVVAALDAWSGRVLLAQHAHLGVPQLVDFYQLLHLR